MCECKLEVTPFSIRPVKPDEYRRGRRLYWVKGANGHKGNGVRFIVTYPGGYDIVDVPEDFKTDLASIPVWCTPLTGPRDQYLEESILHDWFCDQQLPGFFANAKMRMIMSLLDRKRFKKLMVYWALRLFGYGSPLDVLTSKKGKDGNQPKG